MPPFARSCALRRRRRRRGRLPRSSAAHFDGAVEGARRVQQHGGGQPERPRDRERNPVARGTRGLPDACGPATRFRDIRLPPRRSGRQTSATAASLTITAKPISPAAKANQSGERRAMRLDGSRNRRPGRAARAARRAGSGARRPARAARARGGRPRHPRSSGRASGRKQEEGDGGAADVERDRIAAEHGPRAIEVQHLLVRERSMRRHREPARSRRMSAPAAAARGGRGDPGSACAVRPSRSSAELVYVLSASALNHQGEATGCRATMNAAAARTTRSPRAAERGGSRPAPAATIGNVRDAYRPGRTSHRADRAPPADAMM